MRKVLPCCIVSPGAIQVPGSLWHGVVILLAGACSWHGSMLRLVKEGAGITAQLLRRWTGSPVASSGTDSALLLLDVDCGLGHSGGSSISISISICIEKIIQKG